MHFGQIMKKKFKMKQFELNWFSFHLLCLSDLGCKVGGQLHTITFNKNTNGVNW